ncbi:MAG: NAD(P)H-dependent flavin oxidoreductase [Parasphingopyxis sp.]
MVASASAWPDDRLTKLFGTQHPIIQAPMAGATSPALVAAAMAGGALGSLPCGMLDGNAVRESVNAIRALETGPLNLNFFCHDLPPDEDDGDWRAALAPFYGEYGIDGSGPTPPIRKPFDAAMCTVVEEVRPGIVSFHFGLPDASLLDRVRATGARILSSATTVDEARFLADRGCDAVIAQGYEAGGHRGWFLDTEPSSQIGTFALVPMIVDAVSVPVIAAGGIADARGIAAALALGAAGVQLGTAYLFADEAPISDVFRQALMSDRAGQTVLTNLFSGGVARGIANRLTDSIGAISDRAPPYPYASAALAALRSVAEAAGDDGFSPLWAGQAAPLGAPTTAQALTERLAREALALIGRA